MSARYWVLASDSLFHPGMTWPDGIRLAGPDAQREHGMRPRTEAAARMSPLPGTAWRLIEDDGAGPSFEGQWAELILRYVNGVPEVALRSVVT
jgi:hypothetical protein